MTWTCARRPSEQIGRAAPDATISPTSPKRALLRTGKAFWERIERDRQTTQPRWTPAQRWTPVLQAGLKVRCYEETHHSIPRAGPALIRAPALMTSQDVPRQTAILRAAG